MDNYPTLSPDTRKSLVQNLVMLRNKEVITSIQSVSSFQFIKSSNVLPRLLQTLFPLLPRTTSSTLRAFIRKTIVSDIRTANLRTKNHKLNRAVQAMLFGMIERGMDGEVVGDKGKLRAGTGPTSDRTAHNGQDSMWAVVLTKELWKKGIWCVTMLIKLIWCSRCVGTMPSQWQS